MTTTNNKGSMRTFNALSTDVQKKINHLLNEKKKLIDKLKFLMELGDYHLNDETSESKLDKINRTIAFNKQRLHVEVCAKMILSAFKDSQTQFMQKLLDNYTEKCSKLIETAEECVQYEEISENTYNELCKGLMEQREFFKFYW